MSLLFIQRIYNDYMLSVHVTYNILHTSLALNRYFTIKSLALVQQSHNIPFLVSILHLYMPTRLHQLLHQAVLGARRHPIVGI